MSVIFRTLPMVACAALAGTSPVPVASARDIVPVASPAAHDRLLPLQGGRNFRDLGGYRTMDGRHVRWGLLFRSGSMHSLTDRDYRDLADRGIKVVCDFRDIRERREEPVHWPAGGAPHVLTDDYRLDLASFMPPGDPKTWTAAAARTAMRNSYPRMLVTFRDQHRRMFAELLKGHAPLAFKCSAGKDRTGIAAALLLTALGVPRRTIVADYLLINTYLDARTMTSAKASSGNPLTAMPPAAAQAMLVADRHYINAVFEMLDRHAGGANGWLRDETGLSQADITRLRRMYLRQKPS